MHPGYTELSNLGGKHRVAFATGANVVMVDTGLFLRVDLLTSPESVRPSQSVDTGSNLTQVITVTNSARTSR